MSETPQGQSAPVWTGDRAQVVYANSLWTNAGPFDVQLIFGYQQAQEGGPQAPAPNLPIAEAVRVSMSWGHLKAMIPLLARVVADYESKVGQIPAPGFDENWRS